MTFVNKLTKADREWQAEITRTISDLETLKLPEADHEPEIRAEFYKRRERLRYVHDPFDWMFVQSYAFGQYCGRLRKNIASFDPQYSGGGQQVMTLERLQQWRSMLRHAEAARRDALESLRELSQRADAASCLCYLDRPNIPQAALHSRAIVRRYGSVLGGQVTSDVVMNHRDGLNPQDYGVEFSTVAWVYSFGGFRLGRRGASVV